MIATPSAPSKSKTAPYLPALTLFGPLFIVIGLHGGMGAHGGFESVMFAFACVGALMSAKGAALIYARQVEIERRLDALEGPQQ